MVNSIAEIMFGQMNQLKCIITLTVHYFEGFLVSATHYPTLEPLSIYPQLS